MDEREVEGLCDVLFVLSMARPRDDRERLAWSADRSAWDDSKYVDFKQDFPVLARLLR